MNVKSSEIYGFDFIESSAPAVEPFTLSELKSHLRVETEDFDAELSSLISVARKTVEIETGLVIFTSTRKMFLDSFPDRNYRRLYLYGTPVQTVTHVKYYDGDGVQQTWGASNYTLHEGRPNYIQCKFGKTWPVNRSTQDRIEIQYVAGNATTAAIDERIKQAVKLYCSLQFDGELIVKDEAARIEKAYESLINQLKVGEDFLVYGC
tara:strand:+ start:1132 stop:1752 length:621 start_codon:yes stop_codon:yes gene_type:complete